MNIHSFLSHHGLAENPFDAEEARHDPVFERLMNNSPGHPDFGKILGRLDRPSTSVVFGEKGTGKTALRLLIGQRVAEHNLKHPEQRTLVIPYDDLNPVLDRVTQRHRHDMGFSRAARVEPQELLEKFRLEDHQDAILSLAVTRIVDALVDPESAHARGEAVMSPALSTRGLVRSMPRSRRVDLAVLAALYDQPRSGAVASRWRKLRSRLRLSMLPPLAYLRYGAIALTAAAGTLFVMTYFVEQRVSLWQWLAGTAGLGALLLWVAWLLRQLRLWQLSRQIHKQTPAVERSVADLRTMLLQLPRRQLAAHPWPMAGDSDSRYQLTHRLLDVLEYFGYANLMVLVDRVDEPTLIHGQAARMKAVIWPMFDNKFLQQERIGLKLLLPIELRHMLHRESQDFFQEARLDKQNLIDRLSWSGATLYDLCSSRMQACRKAGVDGSGAAALTELFEQDVSREMLVDALDQMHQPRDAFKFLYAVIQEHCTMVPEDQAVYKIPRLTLESVRRLHAQRVQDLSRGLSPA